MPRNLKITDRALALLRLAAAPGGHQLAGAGEDRAPRDLQPLLEHGYAVRLGTNRAVITPTGRAFLAGVDHVVGKL